MSFAQEKKFVVAYPAFFRYLKRGSIKIISCSHVRVLAHLLSPLLVLHLSAARKALAFIRFFLFLAFRRTFLTPLPAPVTAPGQILFPVEFKTPRNIRIYFTGVPRAAGRRDEERKERRGFTPDPTRLVNVTKKRCILGRREKQRRHERRAKSGGSQAKGVGERVGSSKLLYLGRSPLSERSGRYYFSKTTSSTSNPISPFFFLFSFFFSSPSRLLR